jgi:hypothetical protein
MAKRRKGAKHKNPQNRPRHAPGSRPEPGEPFSVADEGGHEVHFDEESLHPSLRGMPMDAQVEVIMVAPDDEPPDDRAGDLLGTLTEPYELAGGETVPAGYKVYRDLRPGMAGIPAGLLRKPEAGKTYGPAKQAGIGAFAAMGTDSPLGEMLTETIRRDRNYGLAAELARRGTATPENQALAVKLNAMRPDIVTTRPGSGMQPDFDVTAAGGGEGRRLEVTSTANPLPDWFEVNEPGPPAVHRMRAGDVLDVQSRLAGIMAHPPEGLLDFFDAYVTDTMEKAGSRGGDWEKVNRWAGMFWPAQTAKEWCGILAHQLRTARTYQVTAPMVGKVTELYHESDRKITYIEHDDLPWPAGFAYLDKPNVLTDPRGNVIYNRAYSWDTVYIPYREKRLPGVRVISWSHPDDEDAYWTEAARVMINRYGGLGLGNTVVFPFRERIYTRAGPGLPPQDSAPRWLRCLWQTLESVVGTTRRAPADEVGRSARKRAQHASLVHNEVNVVLLRRSMSVAEPGTGFPKGFPPRHDFRWPVDEFWRHARRDQAWEEANEETGEDGRPRRHHAVPGTDRERCAICGARVSYVATYIKGPPGMPLRQRRQLYKLAR